MAIGVPSEDGIVANRFTAYTSRRNFRAPRFLGSGKDGVVYEVESNDFPGLVAVKTFYRSEQFQRERDAYVRLQKERVWQIGGHNGPRMLATLRRHGVILLDVHPENICFQ